MFKDTELKEVIESDNSTVESNSTETTQNEIDTSKLSRSFIDRAIKSFIDNPDKPKHFGSYFIQDKTLTYRETSHGINFRVELIAIYAGGCFIGNSAASKIQDTIQNVTKAQESLISLGIPMIPFNVFKDNNLNIQEFELIEQCSQETVKRLELNPKWITWNNNHTTKAKEPQKEVLKEVHFIGASLFKVGPKYFLFDIDRVEIGHGIFNPFMTEIPRACKTVKAAYESLIPKEVKDAIKKGLDVKRQGEWFLIPVKGIHKADLTPKEDIRWLGKYRPLTLQAGPNRPNKAQFGIKIKNLVKGKFEHSGREHKTIVLKVWHKAVPNTATRSFTIEGDVD